MFRLFVCRYFIPCLQRSGKTQRGTENHFLSSWDTIMTFMTSHTTFVTKMSFPVTGARLSDWRWLMDFRSCNVTLMGEKEEDTISISTHLPVMNKPISVASNIVRSVWVSVLGMAIMGHAQTVASWCLQQTNSPHSRQQWWWEYYTLYIWNITTTFRILTF